MVAPNKAAPGSSRRATGRQCDEFVTPGGCAPVLAHVPSFERNPRGSPDFLTYTVPKAYLRRFLGTWVLRYLACRRLRLESNSSAGLRMQPYPRSPDLLWPAAWHRLPQCPGYGNWVTYCCVALVFGLGFRGNPAIPGWGSGCVCLGMGFGFASPILAGACGACVRARDSTAPCQTWLGCVVWVWALASPRQSSPGRWGVRVCGPLPLVPRQSGAPLCGVGVCA